MRRDSSPTLGSIHGRWWLREFYQLATLIAKATNTSNLRITGTKLNSDRGKTTNTSIKKSMLR